MLARSLLVISIACLSVLGTPAVVENGDAKEQHPDPALYKNFLLFEQYAAAAFCPDNNKPPGGNLLKCGPNICPDVERAGAKSLTQFQNSRNTDVTGYVAVDPTNKLITVFFRGSESIRNWVTDLSFWDADTPELCDADDCQALYGFWTSWQEVDKAENITNVVKMAKDANPDYQIVVGGHSLGGALATIAAASLRHAGNKVDLYTYGSPRVAKAGLRKYIEANSDNGSGGQLKRATAAGQSNSNYRITRGPDLIPQLPPKWTGYQHIGPEYWINATNPDNTEEAMRNLTADDVFFFADGQNEDGCESQKVPSKEAHGWYFGRITKCYPKDDGRVEWRV